MEKPTMIKTPSPPQQSNTASHNGQQITTKTTTTDDKHDNHLSSSQPRYSTSEILQQFPNIKHRFCHKIKVSIPWKDDLNLPNMDTYHKAIHYFFTMVKKHDPHFQILPWNIGSIQCNPISEDINIPETHDELLSYLYNVHVTPSRIKSSMVVTSSYNLGELYKYQIPGNEQQTKLLKTFQLDKLWVTLTEIQTMGEVKLIGFLQYVHPHHTNLKKVLVDLQEILETRNIVVELYRPRAIQTDKTIITAPEALAIGASSDISVEVCKSLMEKWQYTSKGHYTRETKYILYPPKEINCTELGNKAAFINADDENEDNAIFDTSDPLPDESHNKDSNIDNENIPQKKEFGLG
jgi:hypothetical protein